MLSHGATDMDNDNLMEVASHQGKVIAATHAKNKDKLRTAFAYRGAGFSSSSARILAAADEACGLPALPDNMRGRGRDALLGVDTPLEKIQTVLSAHGAAPETSRALSLSSSPMRLRAPATIPSSPLVANGVVRTLDTMQAPSNAVPSVEAAGNEPNAAFLLDALGAFDLFKKRYTIKDDAVYLELVNKVKEGISGAVVVDAGTLVSDLVGLFEGTTQDAKQWTFGHKLSLDIFSATAGRSQLCDAIFVSFLHSFWFFCCLIAHDGVAQSTIENPADVSRLRLFSMSLTSYPISVVRPSHSVTPVWLARIYV